MTDPDWEPIMKRAAAIVTDRGGRTCHAAIVSRELGVPCVVGTGNGTETLADGQVVTVSCAEGETGSVYRGAVPFERRQVDLAALPKSRTKVMLNVGNPGEAFRLAALPNDGVGLARIEFIIGSFVRVHPLALLHPERVDDPEARAEIEALTRGYAERGDYFVDRLAEGMGIIAAAFYPKDVIVRLSDFKTNEYAGLVGGRGFEPVEGNPMLGFRGRVPVCPPALSRRVRARVPRSAAGARGDGAHQPQADDPVLPHAARGRARARAPGGQRASPGRQRPRGVRDGGDSLERDPRGRVRRPSSTGSRSARTT